MCEARAVKEDGRKVIARCAGVRLLACRREELFQFLERGLDGGDKLAQTLQEAKDAIAGAKEEAGTQRFVGRSTYFMSLQSEKSEYSMQT